MPQVICDLYRSSVSWSRFDAKGKTEEGGLILSLDYYSLSGALCSCRNCS